MSSSDLPQFHEATLTDEPDRQSADRRLYVPDPDPWDVHLKRGWDKDYCFMKNPDEDFFHLLMNGELYVQRGDEKYCLNCALRRQILTNDRLYWQQRAPAAPVPEL